MIEKEKEIEVNGKSYITITFITSFDKDIFQKLTDKIKANKGFFIFKIKKWVIPKDKWDDLNKSLQEVINEFEDTQKEREEIAERFLSEYDQK